VNRTITLISLALFLMIACQKNHALTISPPATSTPLPAVPSVQVSSTPYLELTTPGTSFPDSRPAIYETPGEIYTTVLTVPIRGDSLYQYIQGDPVQGPNTLAVLPDNSFLIGDMHRDRIYQFSQEGRLLNTIDLAAMGIHSVIDMRIKGNQLFLLENNSYRVRRLTLDGELISSEVFSGDYRIGSDDLTIAGGLWGMAVDCEGNILLNVTGRLLRLVDIQEQSLPDNADRGYFCDGKRYRVRESGDIQILSDGEGETICTASHTSQIPSYLEFLDAFPDESSYIVRLDQEMVGEQGIGDMTIHYMNPGRNLDGMARVPLSEFEYLPNRMVAVGPRGDVFALVPRPASIDVIRLNFYKQLEPLVPEFAAPKLICDQLP
jgi:hypothetical protein